MSTRYRVFAAVAPGLEEDARDEASGRFDGLTTLSGGIRWSCDVDGLWWALHHLRVPDNIRVRIARFEARDFRSLEEALGRVPWHAYLMGPPADVRVTARKSRLNHTKAIADRVRAAVGHRSDEVGARVYVRVDKDKVIVSADACGDPLHHRGWRRDVGRAPMRETLAAGCIRAAGIHRGDAPVFDPFCGSGTLVFEAAASRAASPNSRSYAISSWPSVDTTMLASFGPVPMSGVFGGADRHESAVDIASANGAVILPDATWSVADARDADPPSGATIVSNLPYGKRLGDVRGPIRSLADLLDRRDDLERVFMIDGSGKLEAISGLRWKLLRCFDNRGLKVRLLRLVR